MKTFWNKVKIITEYSCWEWTGHKDKDGYGRLRANKKDLRAHRVSYELHKGVVPSGLCVCHTCDNPSCVNPNHLFLGTHKDNAIDRNNKGRQCTDYSHLKSYPGESNYSAKLDRTKIEEIRYLYDTGSYSQQKLADQNGVTQNLISKIVLHKIWK